MTRPPQPRSSGGDQGLHRPEPGRAGLEAVLARVADVPGWMSDAQAGVLWDEAAAVPAGGRVVEIGSHLGRSACVLASALPTGARLSAVDPFGADWRYGLPDTRVRCEQNLRAAGVRDRVDLVVATSREAFAAHPRGEQVDLVYVDGKHDALSLVLDVRWARHLPEGGVLLVHDAFSSLGVTTGLLLRVLGSRRLRYVDRTGSLARFVVARPTAADRARMLAQLGWFARNLVVKVLLRLRLRRVAALLGHHGEADPF